MRRKKVVVISMVLLFILTSCGIRRHEPKSEGKKEQKEVKIPSEDQDIETSYGKFRLLKEWEQSEYSDGEEEKFFFQKRGTILSNQNVKSNISVELGTNHYSVGEHEQFREAIAQQLARQYSDMGLEAEITGDGTYTDAGDYLYIFTMKEEQLLTRQYYIVGEYQYVMVQETDFFDKDISDVDKVAQTIAQSFQWKK